MANPQKENGYTSIANEIMDALCRIRINGESRQVLDFIIRKTYGYNKKKDSISLSQFMAGTGLKKVTICKAIKKLVLINIITQKGNDIANEYMLIKDHEKWKPLPKKVITVTQLGNKSLPKKGTTIDNITKDNITIDKGTSEQSSQIQKTDPINKLFQTFYESGNRGINFGNKTERKAAEWLIKEFGTERSINTIKYAMSLQGKQYAPVITTPFQLKNNLAKLMAYYKREQTPKKGAVPEFNF